MPRRSNAQILCDFLKQQNHQRASVQSIAGGLNWDEEKVNRVVDSPSATALHLSTGRGRVVRYLGSERYGEPGIYDDVEHVLRNKRWDGKRSLREVSVYQTSRSGERSGDRWVHPDVVMTSLPRRRRARSEQRHVYSFEVEVAGRFGIQSVYQTHAAGRGATYSWVVFSRSDQASTQFSRIERTARELGVGLITYQSPRSSSTWKVVLEARRQSPTSADRASFLETVLGSDFLLQDVA